MTKLIPNPSPSPIQGPTLSLHCIVNKIKPRFVLVLNLNIGDSLCTWERDMWNPFPSLLNPPPAPFISIPFSIKCTHSSHGQAHIPSRTMACSWGFIRLPPPLDRSFSFMIDSCPSVEEEQPAFPSELGEGRFIPVDFSFLSSILS